MNGLQMTLERPPDRRNCFPSRVPIVFRDSGNRVIYRFVYVRDGKRPKLLFRVQYDEFGNEVCRNPRLPNAEYWAMMNLVILTLYGKKTEKENYHEVPNADSVRADGGDGADYVQLELF